MDDGFYTMTYVGAVGMGLAVFLFEDGKVRGFDMRGGKYDGAYVRHPDGSVEARANLLVLPGVELVTGMPPPDRIVNVPLTARLPTNAADGATYPITVGDRQAQASFKYMRSV